MRLKDKVVLITGASRGVGAAVALACAREGADIALASKTVDPNPRLPGTLGEVAAQIEALGRRALILQTDVRDDAQVEAMVQRTIDVFGRLDALVNNAGAIFWSKVADWPTKRFDLVFGVNVRASFTASRAAIPHLRKTRGTILMMSPPIVTKAAPGKGPYLTSKLGMTILAQAIDGEESDVAACALWPVTAIRSAATENLGMGGPKDWREADILADSTVELLVRGKSLPFRAWLDEEVLSELCGVNDFTKYRCEPDSEPAPMSIQLIDPDWKR